MHPSITRLEPLAVPSEALDGALDVLAQLSEADADEAIRDLLLDLTSHPDAWADRVRHSPRAPPCPLRLRLVRTGR